MLNTQNIQQSIKNSNSFLEYCVFWIVHFQKNLHSHCSYEQFASLTNRAVKPLASVQELLFYTIAYGMQHFYSNHLLIKKNFSFTGKTPLRVFDYGCGQGIASLALMQYLHDNALSDVALELYLIEPSELSLETAICLITHYASVMGLQVKIHAQLGCLQDFDAPANPENVCNLHLLSNIADIESVQSWFAPLAAALEEMPGKHFLLSHAPAYGAALRGNMALRHNFSYADCLLRDDQSAVRVPRFNMRNHSVKKVCVNQSQVLLHWNG